MEQLRGLLKRFRWRTINTKTDSQNPQFQALNNNLILSNIFNHLDVWDLKSVRLVCKTWHDEATTILGTTSWLNIINVLNDSKADTTIPEELNPKLIRRIKIKLENPTSHISTDTKKLASYLSRNHQYVEHLNYSTSSEMLPLFNILQMFEFPALKKIKISFEFTIPGSAANRLIRAAIPMLSVPMFQPRYNLSSVLIKCCSIYKEPVHEAEQRDYSHPKLDNGLKQSFQNLITSAPNLNSLIISGFNFYPDLSQCNNIQECGLYICTHLWWPNTSFDIHKLNFALDHIKSTIRELRLDSQNSLNAGPSSNIELLLVPVMPKLEKLKITNNYSPWKLIGQKRFPMLKKINIILREGDDVEQCLSSFGDANTIETLRSLKITDGRNVGYGENVSWRLLNLLIMTHYFRNAISYKHFQWLDGNGRYYTRGIDYFEELINFCNTWRIGCLEVFVSRASGRSLEHGIITFHRILKWRCEVPKEACTKKETEKYAEKFMNVLLSAKEMKSVVFNNMFWGLNDDEKIRARICTFVKRHGLPVHFR